MTPLLVAAWESWLESAKAITSLLSFWGPLVIWPALAWLWRLAMSLRAVVRLVPKILRYLAVLANRERRVLDIDRRQLFYTIRTVKILRNAAHHFDWPRAWKDELEVIHHELDQLDREILGLRDTAFRAREMQSQRVLRETRAARGEVGAELDQGELDAAALGPIQGFGG